MYFFTNEFIQHCKMEKTHHPRLKDIISKMESIDEIKTWAEQNELLHHPTVQVGMERQIYISNTE